MLKRKKIPVHYLPVLGCIATGIIYVAIGVIAILSFLRIKNGGADENSFLALLNRSFPGKILVWFILIGSLSYIAWRIYETITDPYGYGKKLGGLSKRTGIALSTIADILIVYSAFSFLIGIGNPHEQQQLYVQREMVEGILERNNGPFLIILAGISIAFTAIVQLLYGITRGYHERIEIEEFSRYMKHVVHFLGISGYICRGLIIGIIAFFFIKAGIRNDASLIVNTDKAFDFIGDHIGHVYFILVAAGTAFYGIFMFAQAFSYDIDRD